MLGAVGCAPGSPATPSPSTSTVATFRVVDGDTIEAETSIVRLVGINAPEVGECGHDAASAALQALLGAGPLTLTREISDVDEHGRLLRYVEVAGVDTGAAMLEGGWAIARIDPPDTSRSDAYVSLEAAARASGKGLWAADGCGIKSGSPALSIEVHADPAGDDNRNLNDEWVRLTNGGDTPLDLSGWLVADSSSSNRYRFDDVTIAAGASITLRTGCGADSPDTVYWCATTPVWNNDGDIVIVRESAGALVAEHRY
jgi:micrococcal nuclease